MSVTKLFCASPPLFANLLAEAVSISESKSIPLFVVFTGAKNPSTGHSWCGDCRVAEPMINAALKKLPSGCVFLECDVQREEYRQQDYVYRTHPSIKLKCVPTLFRWTPRGPVASLNDSQCQIEELLEELINAEA